MLDAAKKVGINIKSICGGKAKCGKCRVKVSSKFVNEVTLEEKDLLSKEDIKNSYRLACCTKIFGDTEIYIPWSTLATKQRLQISGEETKVELSPIIKKFIIKIPKTSYTYNNVKIIKNSHEASPKTFSDNAKTGFEIIKDELLKNFNITIEKINSELLKNLSKKIRSNKWKIAVIVRNSEIVYVGSGEEIKEIYGIAIDLGTTKIAIYLVDLETGKTIDAIGIMNPQIAYGEDIISRLQYCIEKQEGSKKLREIVLEELNKEINIICKKNEISPAQIFEVVVVGNTAMQHLFLNLPIKQLALLPFKSVITDEVEIKARDFELDINKFGHIYFPPPIAGFVGSDNLAMLLSSQIFKRKGNVLGIDMGTNTEVVLKTDNLITCCSTASGPAFEGAHIKHGMRASAGAIDSVVIDKDSLNLMISTIDNYPSIGICGSGILDCVAEMLKAKIIDSNGKIVEVRKGVRKLSDGKLEYVLTKKVADKESEKIEKKEVKIESEKESRDGGVKNMEKKVEKDSDKETQKELDKETTKEIQEEEDYITITQNDIREIQLAKGAIRAGIDILLKNANLGVKDIDKVIIAGAFGTYLDIKSSIEIGMFPKLSINRFHQIGNAAGIGAKQILISKNVREKAKELLKNIKYIELTTYPDFIKYFTNAMKF